MKDGLGDGSRWLADSRGAMGEGGAAAAAAPCALGCHNPRVPDRDAMNAILFVLRTGCQRNALNATAICSSSSAHRRLQEWREAGVLTPLGLPVLLAHDVCVRLPRV